MGIKVVLFDLDGTLLQMDIDYYNDCEYDINDAYISDKNNVAGSNDTDYLKNLIKINKINDKPMDYNP